MTGTVNALHLPFTLHDPANLVWTGIRETVDSLLNEFERGEEDGINEA